ncbi:hypothetical protein HW260_08690 [Helicobacter cinaedi]|uniref:hypothetical protein n=1 Tax=Helicobacter cinaedi TaxID=213 RepID=UPI000CF01971|nr:hypothetical protein [Helicobacter cinaedi]AWK61110.1 hypothetical protein C6B36_01205 [Helicobacter cinaedi]QOQ90310.1 hypothetical protein HW260_08690 [Helicobacter cinaedi]QOQ96481.1 hypothetical protein HW245_02055 [Helicobacter cinaedi]
MRQNVLNAKVLDMACEMIIAQDEILRLCLNVLSDELKKQNYSLKICQDSEMAEYYVICQPQEKPCFSVVMGYFAGRFWSGVMYVESEKLENNASKLESLQEHFRAKNIAIDLNAEECVFVESSVITNLGFVEFKQKSLESLPKNLALCQKLNTTLGDFA